MTDAELIEFYERHHDYHLKMTFYECESSIKLSDLVRMMKLVEIIDNE